jgi:hypothetical protein
MVPEVRTTFVTVPALLEIEAPAYSGYVGVVELVQQGSILPKLHYATFDRYPKLVPGRISAKGAVYADVFRMASCWAPTDAEQ